MLDVGLIGLGAEWEHRYRPALLALRHRMCVQAVYAPVASMADQVAAEWRCEAVQGMLALMERPDVRALLILDAAWYDGVPAEFALRVGKPAFLAGRFCDWLDRAHELPAAASSDVTLMPDFGHRYVPATSRLKELIATKLGRPQEISVEVGTLAEGSAAPSGEADAAREPVARALDWCGHLVGTPAVDVRSSGSPQSSEVLVQFRRPAAGGPAPQARVAVRADLPAAMFWNAEIRCTQGTARPEGATQIAWQTSTEAQVETLAGERCAVEVMLDHFSRRAVGGLVPVPSLDDLRRAFYLSDAAERSRAAGRPFAVDVA